MNLLKTGAMAAAIALTPTILLSAPTPALAQQAAPPEGGLIPRADIFGNPERINPAVSPDGKMVAFLAPRDGVMNIHVAPVGSLDEAKPITAEKSRPVRSFFWSPDSAQVLYVQDQGGDENWRVFGTPIAGGETRTYTPFEKTQARIEAVSPLVPDAILVGLNNRDPKLHDLHRLDLKTGKLTLVKQNDGYSGFITDMRLNVRGALKQTPGGGFDVVRLDKDGKETPLFSIAPEDALTTSVMGFDDTGKTAYMLESRGRNTAALAAVDWDAGKVTVLADDPKADVSAILANPRTGKPEAIAANYLRAEWEPVGDALKADIAFLDKEAKGDWSVLSRNLDDTIWTLRIDRVTEPVSFHAYDRQKKTLTKLFSARPVLEGRNLSPMYPVEIKARDGKTLVSYLTLPAGSDKDGDGKPEKPLPMVLNVHGGPWARDSYGYNSEHQWLANRGYAVLAVNYRGSTGFGKEFINAANKEFAGKMHDDLIDAVDWAVKRGVTVKDKVAIYGGSYGGYATLVGLTFTPDTFACGVDIVGPSNLVTLIESFPAYWQPFMEATWYKRVGDPRTEEGRKALLAKSPITRVDQIKKPLLIAQGANDPRVVQRESDQLVEAMQKKNIPVTYVLYPDEGHGFARPQNRTSFYAISEAFLSRCLGGAYQPVGTDFNGSSLQVPAGTEFVPGLKEALAAKK